MSRAESAKKLQEILNDEMCTLVACRQAMERVKEPATVATLRHIASRHEDSISHLRAAIVDRAEEPNDDATVSGPWVNAAKELGAAFQSDAIVASFRKTENLCRERVSRAAATVGLLDETARRMVSELIVPRHVECIASLDRVLSKQMGESESSVPRIEPEMAATQQPEMPANKQPGADAPVSEEMNDSEPHLIETIKGLAGQVAKAGLMAGAYGIAVATQPIRYLLRRGMSLISPTPTQTPSNA